MGRFATRPYSGEGSAELLVELERANLFLVPLDDRREWYRYHQLFAEVLQNQLLRSDAEHAHEVHRRASEWYAAAGDGYEAVRHAVAADELETAITLVFDSWRPSLEQGDAEASLRQLEALPLTNVERDARLALVKAWALGVLNSREDSLVALEAAEAARFDEPHALRPLVRGRDRPHPRLLPVGRLRRDAGRRQPSLRAARRHAVERAAALAPRTRLGPALRRGARKRRAPRSSRRPSWRRARANGSSPASPRPSLHGSRSRPTTSMPPWRRPAGQ